MSTSSKRLLVVTTLGTLGYTSLILQWLWVSVLLLPSLFENASVKNFLLPPPSTTEAPMIEFHSPPLLAMIFTIIITVAVLIVTVIILARLPAAISKTGKNVTRKSAEAIVPALTHHRTLPAQEKRQLTIQTIRLIKYIFTLLPFLLLFLTTYIPTSLSGEIIMLVGAFLALGTLLWFGLEYAAARILKIKPTRLI